MAKLTDVRDTPEIANGAKVIAVPVKGGATIYQGALVALDASGYAIPGKKAESLTAVGRAEETVANTGADGELVIRVARGVYPRGRYRHRALGSEQQLREEDRQC